MHRILCSAGGMDVGRMSPCTLVQINDDGRFPNISHTSVMEKDWISSVADQSTSLISTSMSFTAAPSKRIVSLPACRSVSNVDAVPSSFKQTKTILMPILARSSSYRLDAGPGRTARRRATQRKRRLAETHEAAMLCSDLVHLPNRVHGSFTTEC
jgi:hypothetical protein